jgi:hypothetical protein
MKTFLALAFLAALSLLVSYDKFQAVFFYLALTAASSIHSILSISI